MMPPPTGRHDATAGTYITCGVVLVLAILLIVWAIKGNPFTSPITDPTPIPVVIVTPDTNPPPPPPPIPTGVPTGVSTAPVRVTPPAPIPTGVPTRLVLSAIAAHDGTSPLFGPPCWSNSKRRPATCTPTTTPFPPPPTVTAVPTDTPMPTGTAFAATPTGTAVPTGTPQPTATPTPNYLQPPAYVLAEEAEARRLINLHRQSIGLHQLVYVPVLDLGQRQWAIEMIVNDACYHGDYGGRAYAHGYTGFAWGEAGSCGYQSAADTVQGWLDSPGHRGILEAVNETEFGLGAWTYPNGRWSMWLLVGCGQVEPCRGME